MKVTVDKISHEQFSCLNDATNDLFIVVLYKVDNNLSLYGGAQQFVLEINSLAATILNDLLTKIKAYGDQNQIKKQVKQLAAPLIFFNVSSFGKAIVYPYCIQARLSLELFSEIINWGDLNAMSNLAINLWNFSYKNLDNKLAVRAYTSLQQRSLSYPAFQNLITKIPSP